jgi:hypothetical protein
VDVKVIWVRREQKYFCVRGWTQDAPNSPSGKSAEQVGLGNYRGCDTLRGTPAIQVSFVDGLQRDNIPSGAQ